MRYLLIMNREEEKRAIQIKFDRCRRLSKKYSDWPTAHHIPKMEIKLRKQLNALEKQLRATPNLHGVGLAAVSVPQPVDARLWSARKGWLKGELNKGHPNI
jgi:hypothetical protein